MAAVVASVPLPLLLDSLLASSWTWLALTLATIATLLRALGRIPHCRPRSQPLLPSPSAFYPADIEQISSSVEAHCVSWPALKKSHKRRTACKSTPELQFLLEIPDTGRGCPNLGLLSCLRNPGCTPQSLRKAASLSQIYSGHEFFCGSTNAFQGVSASQRTIDCKLGLGIRLGLLVDSQESLSRSSAGRFIREKDADSHHLQAPIVGPTCKHTQKSLLNIPPLSLDVPSSFERQFGWCGLLEEKLGLPWQPETMRRSFPLSKRAACKGSVVKLWSVCERNLFRALEVEGNSVEALDIDKSGRFACIAQTNGEIAQWDLMNQARVDMVFSKVDSTSALCLKAELKFAIAGSCSLLSLWDFRSPNVMPLLKWGVDWEPYQAIECKGNTLSIHQSNGSQWSCDLRKSQQAGCLTLTTTDSLAAGVSLKMVAERLFSVWEKFPCEEEELWDEPINLNDMDVSQKSGSFTSRCVTLVQSLTSPGRQIT